MNLRELIDEAEALPVEERALVVDSLLRSLNPPESEIDQQWASLAQKRLKEIRASDVQTVPGEDVFAKIWNNQQK